MKPPGGNYQPNKMNINKIPTRNTVAATGAATVDERAGEGGGYTTARVMTASPLDLILIMYEQFLELIPDIKRNIQKRSAASMEPDSERAQAIVEELINALDLDVGMSRDLGAIYYYVRNKILEANIKLDAAAWDHIETVMRPLYEGFKDAARQMESGEKHSGISSSNPSIVAGIIYGHGRLKEIVVNTKSGIQA